MMSSSAPFSRRCLNFGVKAFNCSSVSPFIWASIALTIHNRTELRRRSLAVPKSYEWDSLGEDPGAANVIPLNETSRGLGLQRGR